MAGSSGWYDAHAPEIVRRYEAINPASLHSWLKGLLPDAPGTVLDIGAGSGRDAGWFSAQGYDVVAVEPSTGMRSEGERLHPDPRIRWINDQLPDLSVVGPMAISFDVVMLSAVWQHVSPSHRDRAFRKLAALVRSGGLLAITLRSGPSPPGSEMYPVSLDEIERLARNTRLRCREGPADAGPARSQRDLVDERRASAAGRWDRRIAAAASRDPERSEERDLQTRPAPRALSGRRWVRRDGSAGGRANYGGNGRLDARAAAR